MKKHNLRLLTETAIMLALATVLSELKLPGIWVYGGGITIVSMLPLVLLTNRYGTKYGLLSCFVYSLLQMALGADNFQWAVNVWMVIGIILFDYVLAYTSIGLSAVFKGKTGNRYTEIALGIVLGMMLRFACHFISGWMVWHANAPEELQWSSPLWSLVYNASYMLPEIILTAAVSLLSYKPMKALWEDTK